MNSVASARSAGTYRRTLGGKRPFKVPIDNQEPMSCWQDRTLGECERMPRIASERTKKRLEIKNRWPESRRALFGHAPGTSGW